MLLASHDDVAIPLSQRMLCLDLADVAAHARAQRALLTPRHDRRLPQGAGRWRAGESTVRGEPLRPTRVEGLCDAAAATRS